MKNAKKLTVIFYLVFISSTIFGQVIFNGFDQEQCGLYPNNPYTYENYIDCIDGAGYNIYKNDLEVWSNCPFMDGCSVEKLVVTSDTSVFLIDKCVTGLISVYKTTDSFDNLELLNFGIEYFLGFYLISPNLGYFITYFDSTLYVNCSSDIVPPKFFTDEVIDNDTVFYDSIVGVPFCDIDTLSFTILHNETPVNYAIVFNANPVNIGEKDIVDEIVIFPNPAKEYFRLKGESFIDNSKIEVLNKYGEFVKSFTVTSGGQYYIGDLPKGLYFVRIKYLDSLIYQKLIIN